jgi:unsaturated rhamnogalacturonyl hydrolase
MGGMNHRIAQVVFAFILGLVSFLSNPTGLRAAGPAAPAKPVFLYSRYFNAEGETRYLPDGTYAQVLQRLQTQFEVRANQAPLTDATLAGVKVVLIANPSDQAVSNNPAPHHFSAADIVVLTRYVRNGGGLIIMGNQENHNLEVEDSNKLLAGFGLGFTNLYTDVKKLAVPRDTPVIGGLSWAYYTGNLLVLNTNHPARPRALVMNDVSQKPLNGTRNQPGALLAVAELGRGRVVAVTDAGWITNDVLADKGIGGVVITNHDNWEIFRRLTRWAAGLR